MKHIKFINEYNTFSNIKDYDTLYHGSNASYDVLLPKSSQVINNETAVFATDKKWLSLCFIAKFTDDEIRIGFVNNIPYIQELKKGAFDVFRTSGYVHKVLPSGFKDDPRLGLKNSEFINTTNVRVVDVEKIDDVYSALKCSEAYLIPYDIAYMIKDDDNITY